MTGVFTLRLRECSPLLLEFPDSGKKLPVLKTTNCSLQSAGASGGNRVAGRVTEARATEFWRKKGKQNTHVMSKSVFNIEIHQYMVINLNADTISCKKQRSHLTFRGKLFREVLCKPVLQRKRSCCSWADSCISIPRLLVKTSRRWYAVQVIPVKWAGRIKWASITMFLDTCINHREIKVKIIVCVDSSQSSRCGKNKNMMDLFWTSFCWVF